MRGRSAIARDRKARAFAPGCREFFDSKIGRHDEFPTARRHYFCEADPGRLNDRGKSVFSEVYEHSLIDRGCRCSITMQNRTQDARGARLGLAGDDDVDGTRSRANGSFWSTQANGTNPA